MACELFGAVGKNDPNLKQIVNDWANSCPSTGHPIPIAISIPNGWSLYCCDLGSVPGADTREERDQFGEPISGEELVRLVEEESAEGRR